jgi:hypothetical protein
MPAGFDPLEVLMRGDEHLPGTSRLRNYLNFSAGRLPHRTSIRRDLSTTHSSLENLYYKHILTIISDACTINVSLVFALALASVINYARK